MAKVSRKRQKNPTTTSYKDNNEKNNEIEGSDKAAKTAKRTRKSVPRESPQQRSSVHRGVTRHRWTGRYEAHLWDKNCWNDSQNKKGRQVYLGAYDDEEAAAHAYDLAALKYWGHDTILNFPLSTYMEELKEMEAQSKEEYIGSLRRKSSGFSRGVSKYRGVARHHHNGRWEARIGRVFGNKYLYLGTYATQEEAATAYDMAAIEYRGLNAVTNFDLSRYIKWLRPNNAINDIQNQNPNEDLVVVTSPFTPSPTNSNNYPELPFLGLDNSESVSLHNGKVDGVTGSALGFLLKSSKFKEMVERNNSPASDESYVSSSTAEIMPRSRSFPEHIQTFFDCSEGHEHEDHILFGDLGNSTFEDSTIINHHHHFDCDQLLE